MSASEIPPSTSAVSSEVIESKETGRLEAFSGGGFAIAITLLVLDVKVPENVSLFSKLVEQRPVYLAFVASFLTILSM
jgi:uncharacterized membrane protein